MNELYDDEIIVSLQDQVVVNYNVVILWKFGLREVDEIMIKFHGQDEIWLLHDLI